MPGEGRLPEEVAVQRLSEGRASAVVPSSRPPRPTSGPSWRQNRGWPARQLRHRPHHGQPNRTGSPTATEVTPVADGLHPAHALVAEHAREREREVAVAGDRIRVADPARHELHADLAGPGIVDVHVLDRERGSALFGDRSGGTHQENLLGTTATVPYPAPGSVSPRPPTPDSATAGGRARGRPPITTATSSQPNATTGNQRAGSSVGVGDHVAPHRVAEHRPAPRAGSRPPTCGTAILRSTNSSLMQPIVAST